jgi:hypothetical protein
VALDSPEERFTLIYRWNAWGSQESRSGEGSTLEYTRNLRRELHTLVEERGIRRLLDAPCGDFHWMRRFLDDHAARHAPLEYVGGDIVKPLVEDNVRKHGTARVRFVHLDITRDALPGADLMLCRDCLFHLSFADTAAFFDNFLRSGIPLLLTSTHVSRGEIANHDITTGDFRKIDLLAAPYGLPEPLLRIEDWEAPNPERHMCLWSREQLLDARVLGAFRSTSGA